MAKRMTATEKWEDPWFQNLEPKYKLFWMFILDRCDHAGVWQVNIRAASFFVGVEYSEGDILTVFDGRIIPVNGGERWFIPKFIEFQYGELNPQNRAHAAALAILKKFDLIGKNECENKGLTRPLQGDKDKDKDKDKCIKGGAGGKNILPFEELKNELLNSEVWIEQTAIHLRADTPTIKTQLTYFLEDIRLKDDIYKPLSEVKGHFLNWMKKAKDKPLPATVYKPPVKTEIVYLDKWDEQFYESLNGEQSEAYESHLKGIGFIGRYDPKRGKTIFIKP